MSKITTERLAWNAARTRTGTAGIAVGLVNSVLLLQLPARIDVIGNDQSTTRGLASTVALAFLVISTAALTSYLVSRTNNQVASSLRARVLTAMQRAVRNKDSHLVTQLVSNDIDRLSAFSGTHGIRIPAHILVAVVVLPVVIWLQPAITVGILAFVSGALLLAKPGYRRLARLQSAETRQRQRLGELLSIFESNRVALRANRTENAFVAEMISKSNGIRSTRDGMALTKAALSPVNQSLGTVLVVLYLLGSIATIQVGWATVESTVKASLYLVVLMPSLMGFAAYISERPNSAITASQIESIVNGASDQQPTIKGEAEPPCEAVDTAGGYMMGGTSGLTVTFERQHEIRYPDIRFQHGLVNAVVGPTGCGKTTLLHVLAGIYLVNQSAPDSSTAANFGQMATLLPQRSEVPARDFQDCINVLVGPNGLNTNNLHQYLEQLSVRDGEFNGLEKRDLSEFSGGQQQRIMLAIVLSSTDRGCLLLDEPTASLDRETAARAMQIIANVAESRPVILSTHGVLPSQVHSIELGERANR